MPHSTRKRCGGSTEISDWKNFLGNGVENQAGRTTSGMNLELRRFVPVLPSVGSPGWRHLKIMSGIALLWGAVGSGFAGTAPLPEPTPEMIITGFYAGWEQKDWNRVVSHLAAGFTFTSPAPDDHIPLEEYRAKCWSQADYIAKVEFVKISGDDHAAFAIVHIITRDNRVLRNTDYFTFRGGKIASIEVFFGGNGLGYPTNQK